MIRCINIICKENIKKKFKRKLIIQSMNGAVEIDIVEKNRLRELSKKSSDLFFFPFFVKQIKLNQIFFLSA